MRRSSQFTCRVPSYDRADLNRLTTHDRSKCASAYITQSLLGNHQDCFRVSNLPAPQRNFALYLLCHSNRCFFLPPSMSHKRQPSIRKAQICASLPIADVSGYVHEPVPKQGGSLLLPCLFETFLARRDFPTHLTERCESLDYLFMTYLRRSSSE